MPKRRIPIATPTAPACAVCTTPTKCGTPAWKEKKGPNCVGRADGPDKCGCLNDCGDDDWIRDGRATPCERYVARQQQAAAAAKTQVDLRKFLDAAAGEGLELDGVDAADLFNALYPKTQEHSHA